MILVLRDYQLSVLDDIVAEWHRGYHNLMVQSPPRSGKSVIMAEIARRATANGKQVLFIVHRRELVDQITETFIEQGVDMNLCSIEMVKTASRRVRRMKRPDLILIDEAHHVLAATYMKIIEAFPEAYRLLFTGTPYRMSGKGFTDVVDKLILGKQVSWLIEHKRLSPVKYYAPKAINDRMLKKSSTGDYTKDSMEAALPTKIYGDAVKHYQKLAGGTNAIAYCHSVESAKQLANEFKTVGINAVEVDGDTPKDERNRIIKQFKDGEIQVLTNVELFTEGLDLPGVDTVIQLRPTKSLSLFLQFSMRSMNYREGKTAVIIDHVGNVEEFGLPTDDRHWTIKDRKKTNRIVDDNFGTCSKCFGFFNKKDVKQDKCPYCGAELHDATEDKAESDGDIEIDTTAELTEIEDRQAKRAERLKLLKQQMTDNVKQNIIGKSPGELKNMEELKAYAELHQYKQGWVYIQAKKKGLVK